MRRWRTGALCLFLCPTFSFPAARDAPDYPGPERGTRRRRVVRAQTVSVPKRQAVTAGRGPSCHTKDASRRFLPRTCRRPVPFFFGVKARFFFRRKRNGPCPCRAGTPRRDSGPRKVRPCPPRAATGRPYTGGMARRVVAPHGRTQYTARLGSRAPRKKAVPLDERGPWGAKPPKN